MYSLPVNRRIFLVGAMGSGKTTIGRIVAQALDLEYLDNDYGLSKMVSKSVNELATLDVATLHALEDRYLQSLLSRPGCYIAGVAASAADNLELTALLQREFTIYLHTSLESQLKQSGRKGVGRQGLIVDRDAEIESRYSRRNPRYLEIASLVVEASRDRKRDAQEILDSLAKSS